jgi:hypothetical protein
VSHLAKRRHLVGLELRGLHQQWAYGKNCQTGLPTFGIGQGRQFGSRAGARHRGFDSGRAVRRRTSTGQDQQKDQGEATRADAHAGLSVQGRDRRPGRSSQLFAGRKNDCVFMLEHTFVNSLRFPHAAAVSVPD